MAFEDEYANSIAGKTPATGPAPGSTMVQGPGTVQPSPTAGRPTTAPVPGPVPAPALTKPEVPKDAMGFPQQPAAPAKVTIDMGQTPKPAVVEPPKEPAVPIPGVPDTSPYGDVYTGVDGAKRVRLNEEGKRLYAQEHQRTLARLGPWIEFNSPGAPTPVVRPGKLNFNPLTGRFSR